MVTSEIMTSVVYPEYLTFVGTMSCIETSIRPK